jgi:RNA polymerase sigma-70 factor (ECF subfamily)
MSKQVQQTSPSDDELINRIVEHQQSALEALYQRYGKLVYSLVLRILQTRELAEEVTQDIFLNVWNHPETWNPNGGRLSSWLLTVARYKAIDRVRREQRRPDTLADPLNEDQISNEHVLQPDDPAIEDGHLIRALVTQLPADQAQIIELAFFQGMTHREMADLLDLPLGTVKTRVRLALHKLKTLWKTTDDQASNAESPPKGTLK